MAVSETTVAVFLSSRYWAMLSAVYVALRILDFCFFLVTICLLYASLERRSVETLALRISPFQQQFSKVFHFAVTAIPNLPHNVYDGKAKSVSVLPATNDYHRKVEELCLFRSCRQHWMSISAVKMFYFIRKANTLGPTFYRQFLFETS